MKRFKPIPNRVLLICIAVIIIVKIVFFGLVTNNIINLQLGGGSDADYYHGYAIGYYEFAVNSWPKILNHLNSMGLYNRKIISYLLLAIDLFIIPLLACSLAGLSPTKNQKYFLYLYLLCLFYPTLYIFTFDIYRDVFMVLSFLIGCLLVKRMINSKNILIFSLLFIINIYFGWYLYGLRPYLGFSFILSLFLFQIKLSKKKVVILGLAYILILIVASYLGILDSLVEYRKGFEESAAVSGSTLGLDFSNPALFIPNLILSLLGQLFGLYIINPYAAILFICETIIFYYMLVYVFKNIKQSDRFVRFLLIFFVIYATIWLVGNDNLGTAVRLRLYNYIAIYISFFYILRMQKNIDIKYLQEE